MNPISDESLSTASLIESFAHSPRCPDEHRYHAASTLGLLALFVSMTEDPDSPGLAWHRFCPDEMVDAALEENAGELGFLRDLLDVSAGFYDFLAERGLLQRDVALKIRTRLVELALAFSQGRLRS